MAGPRLIKVTCPECGAALQVDKGMDAVTCVYCRKSSFVHWPNQPTRSTATMPEYGNIHIPRSAVGTSGAVVVMTVLAPMFVFAIIAAVVLLFQAPRPVSIPPFPQQSPSPQRATGSKSPSNACERAAACCKAIQPNNAGCDGFRIMDESACTSSADSLAQAAKAMGKSCP